VTAYSASTALIVTDVQNDFTDPDGSLFVSGAPQVIGFINNEIAAAHSAEAVIIRTQDWHPESTPHFAKDGGIWPTHCVADTWGAEFHPDLLKIGTVVRKGVGGEDGYSGFSVRDPVTGDSHATGLSRILTERSVADVIVVGFATDYCVKETAIDAIRFGFRCTVLADGVRAVNLDPGDGASACSEMVTAGVTIRR